jgi:hypothetical protein
MKRVKETGNAWLRQKKDKNNQSSDMDAKRVKETGNAWLRQKKDKNNQSSDMDA